MTFFAPSDIGPLNFAHELQRKLTEAGSPVISIVAHPGIAATNLMDVEGGGIRRRLEKALVRSMAQPTEAGALPSLYAATADIPGDSYIGPSRMMGMRGAPAPARRAVKTRNAQTARRLWDESEKLTSTAFSPLPAPRRQDTRP
jgi:hypothetical protein